MVALATESVYLRDMSCNVISVEILQSEGFGIPRTKMAQLAEIFENDLPGNCLLRNASNPRIFEPSADGEYLKVLRFSWSSEGSGYAFDTLIKSILPSFEGSADLVFTWETGERDGLRLQNHEVTKMKVVLTLE